MKRISSYARILTAALIATLCSCIENTVPYPTVQGRITDLRVQGQTAVEIDQAAMTVTLTVDESVNLASVPVLSIELSEGARCTLSAGSVLDLRQPQSITVQTYQDYDWTVRAIQTIERRFTVEGQLGQTRFEEFSHRAFAIVPFEADLSAINVQSLKLGLDGCTYTPELVGSTADFRNGVRVTMHEGSRTEEWTLLVTQTATAVTGIDAWAKMAWLRGVGGRDADNGFEYRKADSEQWIRIEAEQQTASGEISAKITGLEPLTSYVCRSYSDDMTGEPVEFTTEAAEELPGGSFDYWHLDGKVWNPWAEGGDKYWDTGNAGATTLGDSNSVPSDDCCPLNPGGKSAYLETRFVGLGMFGKLAGGNIYIGNYAGTDGTNGIVDMGRPFTCRPTRLKGYFKYSPAPIDNVSSEFDASLWRGKPDSCHIYMALGNWDAPYQVRTKPSDRSVFSRSVPGTVAFGEMIFSGQVDQWTEFTIEFEYNSTDIRPRYLLLTCSASKWADYFTGGAGTVMQIDELHFEYD